MFLNSLVMESITPCLAYPEKIKIIANASVDLKEVMSYVGSALKGKTGKLVYNQNMSVLSFTLEGHRYTIHAKKVAITTLENVEQARACLDWIQQQINECQQKMEEISPLTESTKSLTPFDLFKYTPQTNCRECGEATCLAFASKLSKERINLSKCSVLQKDEYLDQRASLVDILEAAGHEVN